MKATEIRRLDNGQYEIDLSDLGYESQEAIINNRPTHVTKTYRSNKIISGNEGYLWTRLPDVILVKGEELQDQLNAWLYDWLQQQKNAE